MLILCFVYNVFKYIPPKAKVIKIFFDNNPVKADKIITTQSYSYTITNMQNKTIINLLNFSNNTVNINISNLGISSSQNINAVNYNFTDLNNKQWNYDNTKTKITSSIQLKPYSYSVITAAK